MAHYFESPSDDPRMRLYRRERVLFDQLYERLKTLSSTPLTDKWACVQARERVDAAKQRWGVALRELDAR